MNGNKRTAVIATDHFLTVNDHYLLLTNDPMYKLAEKTAPYKERGLSQDQSLAEITEAVEENVIGMDIVRHVVGPQEQFLQRYQYTRRTRLPALRWLRDRAASYLFAPGFLKNLLVIWAVLIYAIMSLALTKADYGLARSPVNADTGIPKAKLTDMSYLKNIPISYPPPQVSFRALWIGEPRRGEEVIGTKYYPGYIRSFRTNVTVYGRSPHHISAYENVSVWLRRQHSSNKVLLHGERWGNSSIFPFGRERPTRTSFTRGGCCDHPIDVARVEHHNCTLDCGKGFSGSGSSTARGIGSAYHFTPLPLSKISVGADNKKSQSGDKQGHPITSYVNKKWQSVTAAACAFCAAFCLVVVGFWFVYAAGAIVDISVINVSKVMAGILCLLAGWIMIHVSLDLLFFQRIYWEHLLL
jgi:hypothetical protein